MRMLILVVLLASLVFADGWNQEALKAAHVKAMQANGVRADGQFMVQPFGKSIASIYLGSDMGSGYTEQGDRKIYWEVIPIEGGIKIIIKVEIFGQVFEKVIIIKFENNQANISVDSTAERVDWMCLLKCAGTTAFKCFPQCGTDWKCWITCAGADVVSCVMGCF